MTQRTIAWLAEELFDIRPYSDRMKINGFLSARYTHALSAIDGFVRGQKYSLIVVNPHVAPGRDYESDPEMRRIMEEHPERNPDYWKFGLRVIELTKGDGSINKDTPLVVVSSYLPVGDRAFPQARETCLRAGAVEYFDVASNNFATRFCGRLEQLARGN